MITITKWVANDGKEFPSEEECRRHEVFLSLKTHVKAVCAFPKDAETAYNLIIRLAAHYDFTPRTVKILS